MGQMQDKTTAAEYLAWEQTQPDKHEFYRGEIFAMVGVSRAHAEVAANVLQALRNLLRGKPCRAYGSDVKVRVEAVDAYYYPDVLVTCSPKDLSADQVMSEPRVLVEVLSPSTATYDRGLKFAAYRQLPSLEQYLLIDPAELTVESYQRTEGGSHGGTGGGAWLLRDVPRGGELAMPALGLRLSWADVFRYVDPLVAEGD